MPKQLLALLMLLVMILTACTPESTLKSQPTSDDTLPYETEVVARELSVPWEMDITTDGRIFFTERPGQIRLIQDGQLQEQPVISFDSPFVSDGEGGLLGLVLDPDFSRNRYLYVYHTYEENGERKNRVLRLIENDNQASVDRVLIDDLPGAANHNGGRMKIGPDGYLYITTGDRYDPPLAQDGTSTGGKILRIGLDGSIPESNPFASSPVYSYGHRNPQGLAWDPETKQMVSSEHGQTNYDEINVIEPGNNYGWPLIQGDQPMTDMVKPILHSGRETWAPSGMTFVSQGPWKGELLVAGLRGERLLKISLSGKQVDSVESLFEGKYGRIRNVVEAADGSLYLMTNNQDGRGNPREHDDQILRLKPVE